MGMIDNDWLEAIQPEFGKTYYKELFQFVKEEYRAGPLSQCTSGSWSLFFGTGGSAGHSAIPAEYL